MLHIAPRLSAVLAGAVVLTGCGATSPPHHSTNTKPAIVSEERVDFQSWAQQLNESDTGAGPFTYADTETMYVNAAVDCRQPAAAWRSTLLNGGSYTLNRIETVYVCPAVTPVVDTAERSVLAEVHTICRTPPVQRTALQEAAIANWKCATN